MEGSVGSEGLEKPWDHAWSTEEMRNNRKDWSLASDSGLLKHLQQFSENLTKKANETQDAINSMTSQLNETAILVDNITNTSLALANTQFIESRVQEDNIEIEQQVEDTIKNENDHEFSATDLLLSVCESIRQGLSIMDEKYEKVEVLASDSEDEDDNPVPSVILKPKDPYQDRPLPYVIGTEEWKSSNKVGLESSSSESEQNDEDEDSVSTNDDKNIGNILSSNACTNLGVGRLSSPSSESNDYNVESSSIKDIDNSRLHARSQDTLNSDTEPTTPSSILPKTQNVNNGPPSFAEELAKRLVNVLPSPKVAVTPDLNEQNINPSKSILSPEDDEDVFSNKSDNLFSEGKNLFSDEVSSSSWKNKPIKPVNKNIIPPSIDVPPPLSIISSAPKTTIDDLFGDADDSEDSYDIFSKKSSKDIFTAEKETVRSEVTRKQKNLNIENIQNANTMTTSTPETNDKGIDLFKDIDDDDLFGSDAKQVKSSVTPSLEHVKKKPVGGVSILGKVDILSSSKFPRRASSSSDSSTDSTDQRLNSNNWENAAGSNSAANSKSSSNVGANVSSLAEAGNATRNSVRTSGDNSSGISVRQPSVDYTAGSSMGSDFQPLISSTRLMSEEFYRERVDSDSLFYAGHRTNNNSANQQEQQQSQPEVVSEHEDVFGPPPLPKASDNLKSKSKVSSLFDDSDSGDDLFASASPSSRSLKSSERTPSKTQSQKKKKSLFDDDNDLFGPKDAPDVDLFGAAPVKSLTKVTSGLFDEVDDPVTDGDLFGEKSKSSGKKKSGSTVNKLFGEDLPSEKDQKGSEDNLFSDNSAKVNETKTVSDNLFDEVAKSENLGSKDSKQSVSNLPKEPTKVEKSQEKKNSKKIFDESEDSLESDLFAKISKPASSAVSDKSFSSSAKNLFEDTDSDLFGSSSKNILERNIEQSSDSLFSNSKDSSDLFNTKASEQKTAKQESSKDLFEDKPKIVSKPKKLPTSIFGDSDEDDQDLFGGSSLVKKISTKPTSIFEENKDTKIVKKMDEEKKAESEKVSTGNDEKVQDFPIKSTTKAVENNSIFNDDDDDDDLFGEKSKVVKKEDENESENVDTTTKTEIVTKPEIKPKNAVLAEIKQKLEKQKIEQSEKSESNVVDGAIISKKEPPKSLKIQTALARPDESLTKQQPPKKPVVSDKMKNLMGKMGKILSPTDTPPLWRKKTEEKIVNDDEQEASADLGSSGASTPSLASGASSPQTSGTNSRAQDSPSLKSDNTEVAISFDEPAQVETLTSIASKSRARIPAKRRPQSRHARQSALRHSGIDFDIVDTTADGSPTSEQQPNGDIGDVLQITVDRLQPSKNQQAQDGSRHNALDSGHADDKSEISASRNTTTNLLSPSTDEEDLFDVPPDLPEDPAAKEDSLFGRAPILSPIEAIDKPRKKPESARKESATSKIKETHKEEVEKRDEKMEEKTAPLDPLRDDSHDPLKDPSQLFAFVTKTPSPEKNKGLLLNEDDDSLFSSTTKPIETKSKPTLDLFVDEDDASSSDLFSSNKTRIKKPLKDTKIDLFDEAGSEFDDDDSLFGSVTKKEKIKVKESSPAPITASKVDEKMDAKSTKTAVKDIFENSSDDDDIFASNKKALPKKMTKSLFDDDENDADDDDDIFGKPKSSLMRDNKLTSDNGRPVVKKAVTRDLKKTAEKIVEDPLSMLQDD